LQLLGASDSIELIEGTFSGNHDLQMVLHGFTIQEKGFAMLQIWESMMVFSCPNFWTVLKKVYDSMCSIFGVDTHYHSKPLGIGCGSSSNP